MVRPTDQEMTATKQRVRDSVSKRMRCPMSWGEGPHGEAQGGSGGRGSEGPGRSHGFAVVFTGRNE